MSQLKKFIQESGFKVLAIAKLSPPEYSIVLYLINCAASRLDEVITTDAELSSLINYEEPVIRHAIDNLSNRNIIRVRYGAPHANPDIESLRIGMQFKLSEWIVDMEEDLSHNDAVVFPFRRSGERTLQILRLDDSKKLDAKGDDEATWRRVFESFIIDRSLDEDEIESVGQTAMVLAETHPIDQVLLMIRHFGGRIPTLSLLASSWQHYQELYEEETQKVDMLGARQKHQEFDEKLRSAAKEVLRNSERNNLTEEERGVLDILIKHGHPRRQLFWAFQARSRYPNLADFFESNYGLMLAVTSTGKILSKPKEDRP